VNGSAFGVGIYLAKNPMMSMSYIRNHGDQVFRLLVCKLIKDSGLNENTHA